MPHNEMIDPELVNYRSVSAPMEYLEEGRKLMLASTEEMRLREEATLAAQPQDIGTQVQSFVKRLFGGE